jgi:hypothetical protein
MPKDPFKNILHEAALRNKYEFNYIKPKTTNLYDDYQRKKEMNKQKMRSIFDKTPYLSNQEGLDKAYASPKYVYQNGETLYIGGTQTAHDIWDDLKIPFNKVDQSQRYKDASQVIEKNIVEGHPIHNIVAHSLGASAGLKLVDKYPNYPMTTTSYGAPIAVASNQLISPIISGERYRHPYDGVSGFDYGAKTIPIQDPKVWNPHSYQGYGNKDKQ